MVVPDQVTGLIATARNGEVFLTWDIPEDNNDPITDYLTEYKLDTSSTWITLDNGTIPLPSVIVSNLTNGLQYDFRVSAINATGAGLISATFTIAPVSGFVNINANVLLILKDHDEDVDLSQAYTSIEYREGIPQSLKITLSAAFGQFLTKGETIQKYDRIFCRITDARGNILQDVFHVRKIKRSRKGGKGKQLILICPHQSENLWKRTITFVGKRISGNEALIQVVNQLNLLTNIGSDDPIIVVPTGFVESTKINSNLDENTSNNYIFEKLKVQQVFDEITDVESQPVEGGGSFQPFYIRFKSTYDHDTNSGLSVVNVQAYPQGFTLNTTSETFSNIPNVTLTHGTVTDDTTNTLENDSDEDPELATNLHLVCDKSSGDFIGDWTMYFGAKEVFLNVRTWESTLTFQEGHLVNNDGSVYECIAESTDNEPPNASFWIERFFTIPDDYSAVTTYATNDLVKNNDIAYKSLADSNLNNEPFTDSEFWRRISYVPTLNYSPETKQKAQYWINALAGAKYAATQNGRTTMVDPNVVIDDTLHPRTFVRLAETDPDNIPEDHLVNENIPDAYRILVIDPTTGISTGTGDFAGTDRNGLTFAGNIAEYEDPNLNGTGEWVVFKGTELADDQEVFEWDEGLPWIKNPCLATFTLTFADRYVNLEGQCTFVLGGEAPRAEVWSIGSYGLAEIAGGQFGVFYDPLSPIEGKQFDCAHSVKWDSDNSRIDCGNKGIFNEDADEDSAVFIKASAASAPSTEYNPFYVGFNFWSLVPLTSNDIPFGTVTAGEVIALPTMDFNNLFRTADASIEWFGRKSEQYRPIKSFAMIFEFIDTFVGSDLLQSAGDYDIGIYLIDRRDNVRIISFTQGKNNDIVAQEGNLPGEFYKGVPGSSAIFSAKEPENTDAFDPREFLVGGIYTRDSFDSQGRYQSGSIEAWFAQLLLRTVNRFASATELEMAIDGFRRVKPLYVTNVDEPNNLPTRNIETVDQKNLKITGYQTAKNLIIGLARLFGFAQQRFEVKTSGRTDLNQGDVVYYTDSEQVDDTTDSINNTLKMVVDEVVHTITKAQDGPGGFTSTFSLVTRLYPE